MKKNILLLLLLHASFAFARNSIIVLYGCSSTGKTTIATALMSILPGTWKYIPANQFKFGNGNAALWQEVNKTVAQGYSVIVDTHDAQFLADKNTDTTVLSVLLYCSPQTLIEHIDKRNTSDDQKTHRKLKNVFNEFCRKYKSVSKNQSHIDTLHKDELKNSYRIFASFAVKKLLNEYFPEKNQNTAYLAPRFGTYDCFVNTGEASISDCAYKIKRELISRAIA